LLYITEEWGPAEDPKHPSLNSTPGCLKVIDTFRGVASSGLSDSLSAATRSAAERAAPKAARIGSLVPETIALVNPARNYAQFLLRTLLPMPRRPPATGQDCPRARARRGPRLLSNPGIDVDLAHGRARDRDRDRRTSPNTVPAVEHQLCYNAVLIRGDAAMPPMVAIRPKPLASPPSVSAASTGRRSAQLPISSEINAFRELSKLGLQAETPGRESDESTCAAGLRLDMMRTLRRLHANAADEISVDREDR
jgi:hypothetical protein